MKSNNVIRLSRRAMSSLSLLKTATMVILLSGLAIYPDAAQATSAKSNAHVYLIRGVLNIFSLGMDEIAVKLQRQGISATVHNYLLWAPIADDAAAKYKSGVKNIILVGHSSGATALPNIVARLDQQGVPVKLVVGLDSMFRTSLAGRVGRYVNFYVAGGAGTRVERTKGFQGKLENVDVEKIAGVSHLTIDKSQLIQQKVIAAIDAAVLGDGGIRRGEKRQPLAPGGSPSGARAKPAAGY